MTGVVLRGDAAALLLPDASVDLIVTSPPYFGLRSYLDGGQHYAGQIGDEATPGEYLDALIACTREWVRVLKPGGSLFVNLGDKYAGSNGAPGGATSSTLIGQARAHEASAGRRGRRVATGAPAKSLIGLPWRYALRCVDELGLILRAEIVWSKPNGLPESVTDRVRRSHEQVFHLTRSPRYFEAVDEVREPHLRPGEGLTYEQRQEYGLFVGDPEVTGARHADAVGITNSKAGHPLGKLPGSVWEIPTAPLKVPEHLGVDHFAAYPPELVRRIVLGWSPREVCTACGEGRRPVASVSPMQWRPSPTAAGRRAPGSSRVTMTGTMLSPATRAITGYACGCPDTSAPATRGVVLDPFGGTGTTALVASVFGRLGISVDLSADYCRLAEWRLSDPGERARALDVPKPPEQVDGQLGLFEDLTPVPKPIKGGLHAAASSRPRECPVCNYRTQYSNRRNCEKCGAERLPA